MPVEKLPIYCFYDKQRFTQFGSQDCANWYGIQVPTGKDSKALYPAMGRKHIHFLNENKLIFEEEPRGWFKSIDYVYAVVGSQVIQIDRFYNQLVLQNDDFNRTSGAVWFAYLAVNTTVYCMLTAPSIGGRKVFIIVEDGSNSQMVTVSDPNTPDNPLYVAAFGNRFTVSSGDTPQFYLSRIGLTSFNTTTGVEAPFDPSSPNQVFSYYVSNGVSDSLFASASGKIQQMGVLHNQLYLFTDFNTDIWANIPSQIGTEVFPWKFNTSYNFDYGIADPNSLDIDFGMMVWLARNSNGLVSFMMSTGQQPNDISTQAINVLLERSAQTNGLSPFLESSADGFLYQYENTVFYRVSAGKFMDFGILDIEDSANCLEYNFDTQTWHRCIELNGERNRIQKHVFFNNRHLVTVSGDNAAYEMAGDLYYNELRNEAQPDTQAANAFLKYPMRYELTTRQIFMPDYSEFITDYVQIDFVFGDKTFYKNNAPFFNTVYVVDEASTPENPIYVVAENDAFIIQEGSNTPQFDDNHYYALFKPHIELYWSDDGGISFNSASNLEFSPLGFYSWRIRWYELGASRNRCYRLVCVSSAPIVILGGVMSTRRSSGGAN